MITSQKEKGQHPALTLWLCDSVDHFSGVLIFFLRRACLESSPEANVTIALSLHVAMQIASRLALWGRSEPFSALSFLPMSPYLFMKPPRMHWQTFEARRDEVMGYERRFWQVKKAILTRLFTKHDGA